MSTAPFRCGSPGDPVTRTSAWNVPLTFETCGTKAAINPRPSVLLFTAMSSSSPGRAARCSSAVWAAGAAGSGALKNAAGTNPFAAIHASGVWESLVSSRTPSTAYTTVPSNDWYWNSRNEPFVMENVASARGASRVPVTVAFALRVPPNLLLPEHERIHARDVHRLRPNLQCVPGPAERSFDREALRPADQAQILDRYAIAAVLDGGLAARLRPPFDPRGRHGQVPQVDLLVVGVHHDVATGGQRPLLLDDLCVEPQRLVLPRGACGRFGDIAAGHLQQRRRRVRD